MKTSAPLTRWPEHLPSINHGRNLRSHKEVHGVLMVLGMGETPGPEPKIFN